MFALATSTRLRQKARGIAFKDDSATRAHDDLGLDFLEDIKAAKHYASFTESRAVEFKKRNANLFRI